MALPKAYLTSTKNLSSIIQAIQSAQAPSQFTARYLEGLGFSSSNDRFIINVLKSLGFLDSEGRPQDRYFRFLDQTQSEQVMAEAVREAYADLFLVRKDAQNLTKTEVINKAKTLSQGALSDSVLDKFAMTFLALCGLSDFSKPPALAAVPNAPDLSNAAEKPIPDSSPKADHLEKRVGLEMGGLHYNIQIVLPQTRDPAIYDAIFRSLREHLIG